MAGIAAGNDGTGPAFGVAREAGIIAIQVFSRGDSVFCFGGSDCVGAYVSDQIKGLERVYALSESLQIAAVNMSLGGGIYFSRESCDADNPARKAAIDNLRSVDIATVVASGNGYWESGVSAPACISSAISVGATSDADQVAEFSNVAPFLDLLAPGVNVESSVPGGGTTPFDGTSMAAPHVAGAWAVLREASPSATVSDVLALLRGTAVSVDDERQWGFVEDLRRIDLARAVSSDPLLTRQLTIHNDGTAVLSILSMDLEQHLPWIEWTPKAPFDIAPGAAKQITVTVDFSRAPEGVSTHRLLVVSTDADESPYPDGVHLIVNKLPCYLLTRSHTGSGSHPLASPSSSSGCSAGRYHAGEVIGLTASPAPGWVLESWSGTDDDSGTSPANAVTMPAGGHAVAVSYFAPCHALTRTHTGSGADPEASPAGSPGCPAGQYHIGEEIQLTASPADGWRIGGWTGTDNDASRNAANFVTMPDSPPALQPEDL